MPEVPDGRGLQNQESLNSVRLVVSHRLKDLNNFEILIANYEKPPGVFLKSLFYFLMSETSPIWSSSHKCKINIRRNLQIFAFWMDIHQYFAVFSSV